MDRTVRSITHQRPRGDWVTFYPCSGFRIEFSFWSRTKLSKGLVIKNFTLSDQYLSFRSLTQPESCFVHLGNKQQVKQSPSAAVLHSSCFQPCVGPLAACHEHPVVPFLWDGRTVSQHISKQCSQQQKGWWRWATQETALCFYCALSVLPEDHLHTPNDSLKQLHGCNFGALGWNL